MFAFSQVEPRTNGQVSDMEVPLDRYMHASLEQGQEDSMFSSISKMRELSLADSDPDAKVLAPEEANNRYSLPGLKWDRPVKENVAQILNRRQQAELDRQFFLSQDNHSVAAGLAGMGASMAGSLMNPLDLATLFLPIVGEEGVAAKGANVLGRGLLRGGLISRQALGEMIPAAPRLAESVIQGVGYQAIQEGANIANRLDEGKGGANTSDLESLGLGALMAGGIHLGIKGAAALLRRFDPATQDAMARKAMDDFVKGEQTDVTSVAKTQADAEDPNVNAEIRQHLKDLRQQVVDIARDRKAQSLPSIERENRKILAEAQPTPAAEVERNAVPATPQDPDITRVVQDAKDLHEQIQGDPRMQQALDETGFTKEELNNVFAELGMEASAGEKKPRKKSAVKVVESPDKVPENQIPADASKWIDQSANVPEKALRVAYKDTKGNYHIGTSSEIHAELSQRPELQKLLDEQLSKAGKEPIPEEGVDQQEADDAIESIWKAGFFTNKGRFLTREQAAKQFGGRTMEEIGDEGHVVHQPPAPEDNPIVASPAAPEPGTTEPVQLHEGFHGSREREPGTFDESRPAFFTSDINQAKFYATGKQAALVKATVESKKTANVADLEAAVKAVGNKIDPARFGQAGDHFGNPDLFLGDWLYFPEIRDELKKQGFDAFADTVEEDTGKTIVAFHPSQIKNKQVSIPESTPSPTPAPEVFKPHAVAMRNTKTGEITRGAPGQIHAQLVKDSGEKLIDQQARIARITKQVNDHYTEAYDILEKWDNEDPDAAILQMEQNPDHLLAKYANKDEEDLSTLGDAVNKFKKQKEMLAQAREREDEIKRGPNLEPGFVNDRGEYMSKEKYQEMIDESIAPYKQGPVTSSIEQAADCILKNVL